MQWHESIKTMLAALDKVPFSAALAYRSLRLLDVTSLNDSDTEASIAHFCDEIKSSYSEVAGICVSPPFARLVATQFAKTSIKTMTVANFPSGNASLESVLVAINQAMEDGVQEIDVVMPYTRFLAGELHEVHDFIAACKAACGDQLTLKIILETGALGEPATIAAAATQAILAGADFLKTSTGKIATGATLEAAATLLQVIAELSVEQKRAIGLKVSGGIRSFEQAARYLVLAEQCMGDAFCHPKTFRIGASKFILAETNNHST